MRQTHLLLDKQARLVPGSHNCFHLTILCGGPRSQRKVIEQSHLHAVGISLTERTQYTLLHKFDDVKTEDMVTMSHLCVIRRPVLE